MVIYIYIKLPVNGQSQFILDQQIDCEFIIIRGIPIFVDFVDSIKTKKLIECLYP